MSIKGAISDEPNDMAVIMEYTAGDLIYLATSLPGTGSTEAKWRVKKYTYTSGAVINITWANGNLNFDNAANDMANLSYS